MSWYSYKSWNTKYLGHKILFQVLKPTCTYYIYTVFHNEWIVLAI